MIKVMSNVILQKEKLSTSAIYVNNLKEEINERNLIGRNGKFFGFLSDFQMLIKSLQLNFDVSKPIDLLKQIMNYLYENITIMLDYDDPNEEQDLLANLGYFMVVVNQVTAYSRNFNSRTNINPTLIGNMAIAVNDFSKELFDDFNGVQTIKQENGTMLIHRADQDIYFVAMIYQDSSYYQIWLQEFASKTLSFFQKRMTDLRFENSDLQKLDEIIDMITGFQTPITHHISDLSQTNKT